MLGSVLERSRQEETVGLEKSNSATRGANLDPSSELLRRWVTSDGWLAGGFAFRYALIPQSVQNGVTHELKWNGGVL